MTIICAVAADFVNSEGGKYSVTGKELGVIKEAPEWIKETLLFKWLVSDGSLKFVTRDNRISAENDPLAGLNAEGKEIRPDNGNEVNDPKESNSEETVSEAPKKRTRKKKDDAE